MTNYFPIMLFPVIYVAAKFVMGVRTVSADDMDFVSDVAAFDSMTCAQHCYREKTARARTMLTTRVQIR